jgi:hypothetical protein
MVKTFREMLHQQAVDEDISATDAAQEDQVNAVVEEGITLTNVRNAPDQSAVYGFWDQAGQQDNRGV